MDLDLSEFHLNGDKSNYKLYAVLVHKGKSTNSGHYFSYVKISDDKWIKMDDSNVVNANKYEVLNHQFHGVGQPYLLFYKKI